MLLRQIAALARLSILDLYRRKDLVVVFLLAAVAIVPLAFFAPFGVPGAGRQMSEKTQTSSRASSLIWRPAPGTPNGAKKANGTMATAARRKTTTRSLRR